jgi:hypothetical protein
MILLSMFPSGFYNQIYASTLAASTISTNVMTTDSLYANAGVYKALYTSSFAASTHLNKCNDC